MGGGGGDGAMADINVTPLVDVMLVLLIIFMVTAPMMNSAGIEIDLPREEAPSLEQDEDQLIVSIDGELRTYIDDQEFPRAELPKKLEAIAKANPDIPIFLRAAGDVPYREVAAILAAAKDAGMPRVGLVFDPTPPPGE
ncbi:MAG: biopolymer transporter ExbD [Alphaproteobacteria bacterium]|nr:biopolymer transporter ExbD [Alphaproteobacteria bacterium]